MSALPSKADIQSRTWDVRFGPKADVHTNCGVRVLRSNHCKVTPLVTAARLSNGAADRGARPLFVKQRLPVRRHPSGWSGHRLIQRMRVRSVKLRPGDELFCTIVVKPPLARLEARDYRVTRRGAMFRCMLIW
jgi:hypothetical protein